MLSSEIEEEKKRLLENITSANTKRQKKYVINHFEAFLKSNRYKMDDMIFPEKADEILENYYLSLKKTDGGNLKVTTLNSEKYAIARFF